MRTGAFGGWRVDQELWMEAQLPPLIKWPPAWSPGRWTGALVWLKLHFFSGVLKIFVSSNPPIKLTSWFEIFSPARSATQAIKPHTKLWSQFAPGRNSPAAMVTRSCIEIFLEQNLHFVSDASCALKSNPRAVLWLNQTCRCWQKHQTLSEMVVRCLHQYGTALRPVSRLRRFLRRGKCFAEEYSSNMSLLIITQANCQLVVKGENYLPDYTPFTVDKQGKLIKSSVQIRVCGFTKQALGLHCKLKTEHCFADPADQNSQNWWSWTDI